MECWERWSVHHRDLSLAQLFVSVSHVRDCGLHLQCARLELEQFLLELCGSNPLSLDDETSVSLVVSLTRFFAFLNKHKVNQFGYLPKMDSMPRAKNHRSSYRPTNMSSDTCRRESYLYNKLCHLLFPLISNSKGGSRLEVFMTLSYFVCSMRRVVASLSCAIVSRCFVGSTMFGSFHNLGWHCVVTCLFPPNSGTN